MYILDIIQSVFNLKNNDIKLIPLKRGMTNNSFIFSINNERYIIRVPGLNTEIDIEVDELSLLLIAPLHLWTHRKNRPLWNKDWNLRSLSLLRIS